MNEILLTGVPLDGFITYVEMNERARARNEKTPVTVWGVLPPLSEIRDQCYIGTTGYTAKNKWRYLLRSQLRQYADGTYTQPYEIARDYLATKTKRRRINKKQRLEVHERKTHPPLYAYAGRGDSLTYLDIKAAYWSIMSRVGWDVEYLPERYLGSGRVQVGDFPFPDDKRARNGLVGVGMGGLTSIWTGEKLIQKKMFNPYENRILYVFCCDVLNAIARWLADRSLIVYAHTDGFICETDNAPEVQAFIEHWGFEVGKKYEGEGRIMNTGRYEIAGKKYVDFRGGVRPGIHDNIPSVPNPVWLFRKFRNF